MCIHSYFYYYFHLSIVGNPDWRHIFVLQPTSWEHCHTGPYWNPSVLFSKGAWRYKYAHPDVCGLSRVAGRMASISCSVCMAVRSRHFSLALNVTSDGHPPSEVTPPSVAFSPPSLVSWSLCYRMINLMLNLEAVFLAQRERDYWQREREWKTESECVYECRRLAIHNKSICKKTTCFFSLPPPPSQGLLLSLIFHCVIYLFAVISTVYCCFI